MRDTTNSGAYQRWKLLVVESAEVFARRDHGRESFSSTRTHAEDVREREKERETEREREREEREKKRKRNGKTSWKAEAVKVRSWLEVGCWAEERRENERMRELRVFRQLGKPSRDRSREDFFSGNTFSFPHLSPPLFSFSHTRFLSLLLTRVLPQLCLLHYVAGPNLSRTD